MCVVVVIVLSSVLSVQLGKRIGGRKKEITMRCETDVPTFPSKGGTHFVILSPLSFLSLSLSLSLSFSRSRLEGYFPSWTKLFHLLDLFLYLIVSLTLTWLVIQLSFFMVPMQQPGPPPSFARPTRISSKLLYLLAFLLHASSSDRHNTQPDDV